MKDKIYYSNLSTPLKIAVVSAWITGIYFAVMFTIGFILGFLGIYG